MVRELARQALWVLVNALVEVEVLYSPDAIRLASWAPGKACLVLATVKSLELSTPCHRVPGITVCGDDTSKLACCIAVGP